MTAQQHTKNFVLSTMKNWTDDERSAVLEYDGQNRTFDELLELVDTDVDLFEWMFTEILDSDYVFEKSFLEQFRKHNASSDDGNITIDIFLIDGRFIMMTKTWTSTTWWNTTWDFVEPATMLVPQTTWKITRV